MSDGGPSINSSEEERDRRWAESQRRIARQNFMISCGIAGVCGLLCWGFGFVGSITFFLGQFGILGSIPTPLIQLAVGIGFGIAGRYGVKYGLLASIYVLGKLSEGLRKLNPWLKTPKQQYTDEYKLVSPQVTYFQANDLNVSGSEKEKRKELYDSLKKLEKLIPDAAFDQRGYFLEIQPPFNKQHLCAWELSKIQAVKNGTLSYDQFYQEVEEAIQDQSKLRVAPELFSKILAIKKNNPVYTSQFYQEFENPIQDPGKLRVTPRQ